MTLFLKSSLQEATKWAVFEPNAEPLWAQIRLSVGAFMNGLFMQGAFVGAESREAYFVKCDSEPNTQTDIDNGILTIADFGDLPINKSAAKVRRALRTVSVL
jgi:uncharacterized protein